ncbi:response regulator transcription factor [Neobacillus vireti]|uniref:Two component LuxR family transcriptional regulator n=1 Tax=Neobacillus vireti LMG 21834 TaxID=1131730 RepID=A0AB94IIJ5_9BACI|nr:response regulator transcription factor [Neobacillus vireti]ETI66874.1 two component LuxR family transcriptional regulator [Neobacillus vireti LMG 21834]KLT15230.1 LuxR family transcriptional regulator [Neobacillus vireti]
MKILIVDDDALIRDGLKILIDLENDFEVTGTAANGQEAFEMCQKQRPDLVLMDIRMPIMDGVLGTKLIKQHFNTIKVVILTTFKDDDYIKEAIKSGAEGYILKNQPSDSIIESLRAVGKGNIVLEREVASALSTMLKDEKKAPLKLDLSDRELEILGLIAEGLSNKEIAQRIYLSEGTIRNYTTGLLEKLKLRDRTQLAIYYLKNF